MSTLRYIGRLLHTCFIRLCRQRTLLALLVILCLCLPLCAAPATEAVFSRGVDFSGLTLAVTAPEGDPVPAMLETLLPAMEDVSKYCQVTAMEYADAVAAMECGDVSAVLVLPENFIAGVMNGSNPDVALIVPADRPLQALLTAWVGQSAADLLSAVQSGIYGVLQAYAEAPPAGLSYEEVVSQINLRYISWTLDRQEMFRTQHVAVAGSLPVGLHYTLSLLCFLLLAATPFFYPLFSVPWVAAQRRLLTAGRNPAYSYFSALTVCWGVVSVILTIAVLLICKNDPAVCVLSSLLCGLFCAAFTGICCLAAPSLGSCGMLSGAGALVFLFLSGGILPPVMLPAQLRQLLALWPVTWMRDLLAVGAGYGRPRIGMVLPLLCVSILLMGCGAVLYRKRMLRKEETV